MNQFPPPESASPADVSRALAAWTSSSSAGAEARQPIGLISDPHACPREFAAGLDLLASIGVPRDRVMCLGDLVDYGHEPGATIRLAQQLMRVLPGNHDVDAAESGLIVGRDVHPADARWLEELCASEWFHRAPLGNLFPSIDPAMADLQLLTIHDSPDAMHTGPGTGQRIKRDEHALDALRVMADAGIDICVVGHVHIPAIFIAPRVRGRHTALVRAPHAVPFEADERVLITLGSVSRPRGPDRQPYAGVLTPHWYSHLSLARL
ncbi:MAG: metallophosphoesterase [Planctomycetota bacterium]